MLQVCPAPPPSIANSSTGDKNPCSSLSLKPFSSTALISFPADLVIIFLSPPEGYKELENKLKKIVDVHDVAEALLLVYEKLEAEGRYICTAHMIKPQDLVDILKRIYPNYSYPKSFTKGKEEEKLSSEKLQWLGWNYRPLEETLIDSIESYKQGGLLD